jgi:hypothetical protein
MIGRRKRDDEKRELLLAETDRLERELEIGKYDPVFIDRERREREEARIAGVKKFAREVWETYRIAGIWVYRTDLNPVEVGQQMAWVAIENGNKLTKELWELCDKYARQVCVNRRFKG